jgi:hypothetical protein
MSGTATGMRQMPANRLNPMPVPSLQRIDLALSRKVATNGKIPSAPEAQAACKFLAPIFMMHAIGRNGFALLPFIQQRHRTCGVPIDQNTGTAFKAPTSGNMEITITHRRLIDV